MNIFSILYFEILFCYATILVISFECKRCCHGPYLYSTDCNGVEGIGTAFSFTRSDIVIAEIFKLKLIPNPLCFRSSQHQVNFFDILGLTYKSDCTHEDLMALNFTTTALPQPLRTKYGFANPDMEKFDDNDYEREIFDDLVAFGFPIDFVNRSIIHTNMPLQRGLFHVALDYLLVHDIVPTRASPGSGNSKESVSFVEPLVDSRPPHLRKVFLPVVRDHMQEIMTAWKSCDDPEPFLESIQHKPHSFFHLFDVLLQGYLSSSSTISIPSAYLDPMNGFRWGEELSFNVFYDKSNMTSAALAHTVVILDKEELGITALLDLQMCTRKFVRHHYWTLLNDIVRRDASPHNTTFQYQSSDPYAQSILDDETGRTAATHDVSSPLYMLPHFTRERGSYLFDRSKLIIAIHCRFGDIGGIKSLNPNLNDIADKDDRMFRMNDLTALLTLLLHNPESVLYRRPKDGSTVDTTASTTAEEEDAAEYDRLVTQVHIFVELAQDYAKADVQSLFSPLLAIDPSIYFHVGSDRNTVTHIDHMVASDILVTSPSSFSLFLASLNKHGLVIHPNNRLHQYQGVDNAIDVNVLTEPPGVGNITHFNQMLCSDKFPLYLDKEVKRTLCSA